LQTASLIGGYGMTFWAVLLGVSPAVFFDVAITHKRVKNWCISLAAIFIALHMWGQERLINADKILENDRYVEGVKLRLVQANIQQPHKWDPRRQMEGLQKHIALTQSPGLESITHVIWPETAVPYVMKPDSGLTRMLGAAIPQNAHLITGTLRDEGDREHWKIWNSLQVINHAGEIVGGYDKSKLVPFGEFLPLRSLIPKGWQTPVGDNDFSRGQGMQTLNWPNLPSVSPLICYEVIFPERTVSEDVRPDWLLSVTNDAWFGDSTGPYQHFHMARMRAVEQGLPLVRVANTGITAEIDPYGRILATIPLGQQGVLDVKLPKPLPARTVFNEHKNIFMLLLVIISGLLMLRQRIHSSN
ncbi:MAG: apolipoprotein N-acyltransferase, partial [Alphaproteobacteria bacterium]|nr:apolipoprotein N-acyltransferase [Alphaproteobacteria bacterium]